MRNCTVALAVIGITGVGLLLAGCSASPMGAAVTIAGAAINDMDVKDRAKTLMGASASQCDTELGQPLDVYRSEQPARDWRVYGVKHDLLGKYRYVIELDRNKVIAVSKAERHGDVIVDAATSAYFSDKCKGKSLQGCQDSVGTPPVLTARNVTTGQLVQLYDARLVKGVQRSYYAVIRFNPDGMCSEVKVVKVAASTESNPAAH